MACAQAREGALHLNDISAGGFLARGGIAAKVGDRIEGVIHVFPLSGDRDVTIAGTVVRAIPDGETTILGVRIDSFDTKESEASYLDFAKELVEDS